MYKVLRETLVLSSELSQANPYTHAALMLVRKIKGLSDLKTMWTPRVKDNYILLDKFHQRNKQTRLTRTFFPNR